MRLLNFYLLLLSQNDQSKLNILPGLRIAPPEAPATGYMFGKGVYFADMFSKSANYCYASRAATTGVLLLCEVVLHITTDAAFFFIIIISGYEFELTIIGWHSSELENL